MQRIFLAVDLEEDPERVVVDERRRRSSFARAWRRSPGGGGGRVGRPRPARRRPGGELQGNAPGVVYPRYREHLERGSCIVDRAADGKATPERGGRGGGRVTGQRRRRQGEERHRRGQPGQSGPVLPGHAGPRRGRTRGEGRSGKQGCKGGAEGGEHAGGGVGGG